MIITFAAQITDETTSHIIEEAARWELNVTDDLDGVLDDPTLPGDHYAILSFDSTLSAPISAKFTTMWYKDFAENFRFVGDLQGPCFRQVQKI